MSEDAAYLDLCSTCENVADCTFLAKFDRPVFHCEDFDIGEPSPIKIIDKDRSPPTHSSTTKDNNSPKFIGLCSDCEDRETCVFPKPEGGIWHCAEYR